MDSGWLRSDGARAFNRRLEAQPTDPRNIAELRKPEREKQTIELRKVVALEHIADTLECIRIELVSLGHALSDARRRS